MKNILDPICRASFLSPDHQSTPLLRMTLAGFDLHLKDETNRMGLGAFKALGGIYAVARLILDAADQPVNINALDAPKTKAVAAKLTFVCASAGNHGMAVAVGAAKYGAHARIHLADTVPESFAIRLKGVGAEVVRSGINYQASVDAAIADAHANGAIHLADGSWPGYTEPPRLVMEGYTTIAEELRTEFEKTNLWPSDIYLQAGVGGLAASIAYMIRHNWPTQPRIIVVEPDAAPCIRESVLAKKCISVEGPDSNMGRLDCKAPSMLAFDILRQVADDYLTVSDQQASDAVKLLNTVELSTTPSGAAGIAGLLEDPQCGARPLVIISEGAL